MTDNEKLNSEKPNVIAAEHVINLYRDEVLFLRAALIKAMSGNRLTDDQISSLAGSQPSQSLLHRCSMTHPDRRTLLYFFMEFDLAQKAIDNGWAMKIGDPVS